MSGVIHYKFKSHAKKKWQSITFDGLVISVIDLKRAIVQQAKLIQSQKTPFDLLITNVQTGEDYKADGRLIPRNSSVIVRRVPANRATAVKLQLKPDQKVTDPEVVNNTEEEAALRDILDTNAEYHKSLPQQKRNINDPATVKPPASYICHRCGQGGHFIRYCPTNGDRQYEPSRPKQMIGIPRRFLQPVSDPKGLNTPQTLIERDEHSKANPGGTFQMPDGSFGVYIPNESVFDNMKTGVTRRMKEERTHRSNGDSGQRQSVAQGRNSRLHCPLCRKLFKDAVVVPCCFTTFCNECIRQALVENRYSCPECKVANVNPEELMPNSSLQKGADEARAKEREVSTQSKDRSTDSRKFGRKRFGGRADEPASKRRRGPPPPPSVRSPRDSRDRDRGPPRPRRPKTESQALPSAPSSAPVPASRASHSSSRSTHHSSSHSNHHSYSSRPAEPPRSSGSIHHQRSRDSRPPPFEHRSHDRPSRDRPPAHDRAPSRRYKPYPPRDSYQHRREGPPQSDFNQQPREYRNDRFDSRKDDYRTSRAWDDRSRGPRGYDGYHQRGPPPPHRGNGNGYQTSNPPPRDYRDDRYRR